MTRERAAEIIQQAQSLARHGPWSDQLDKVMSPDERDDVLAMWKTMPGYTCFVHALFRIRDGVPPGLTPEFGHEKHQPQG